MLLRQARTESSACLFTAFRALLVILIARQIAGLACFSCYLSPPTAGLGANHRPTLYRSSARAACFLRPPASRPSTYGCVAADRLNTSSVMRLIPGRAIESKGQAGPAGDGLLAGGLFEEERICSTRIAECHYWARVAGCSSLIPYCVGCLFLPRITLSPINFRKRRARDRRAFTSPYACCSSSFRRLVIDALRLKVTGATADDGDCCHC